MVDDRDEQNRLGNARNQFILYRHKINKMEYLHNSIDKWVYD